MKQLMPLTRNIILPPPQSNNSGINSIQHTGKILCNIVLATINKHKFILFIICQLWQKEFFGIFFIDAFLTFLNDLYFCTILLLMWWMVQSWLCTNNETRSYCFHPLSYTYMKNMVTYIVYEKYGYFSPALWILIRYWSRREFKARSMNIMVCFM